MISKIKPMFLLIAMSQAMIKAFSLNVSYLDNITDFFANVSK